MEQNQQPSLTAAFYLKPVGIPSMAEEIGIVTGLKGMQEKLSK